MGLPGKYHKYDNKMFIRSTYFLHKSLNIPVTYFREHGKIKKLFF